MGATGKRFSGVGRITALDPARQELRVQIGNRSQAVLAAKAKVRGPGGTVPFKALRPGARVRVSGLERKGVIAAQRVDVIRGSRQRGTEITGSRR
jgi:hypothetical protein